MVVTTPIEGGPSIPKATIDAIMKARKTVIRMATDLKTRLVKNEGAYEGFDEELKSVVSGEAAKDIDLKKIKDDHYNSQYTFDNYEQHITHFDKMAKTVCAFPSSPRVSTSVTPCARPCIVRAKPSIKRGSQ